MTNDTIVFAARTEDGSSCIVRYFISLNQGRICFEQSLDAGGPGYGKIEPMAFAINSVPFKSDAEMAPMIESAIRAVMEKEEIKKHFANVQIDCSHWPVKYSSSIV